MFFVCEVIFDLLIIHSRKLKRYWSSCSYEHVRASFELGLDLCLKNIPGKFEYFASAVCGNLLIEENEECDCGSPEDCKR